MIQDLKAADAAHGLKRHPDVVKTWRTIPQYARDRTVLVLAMDGIEMAAIMRAVGVNALELDCILTTYGKWLGSGKERRYIPHDAIKERFELPDDGEYRFIWFMP